eukprot:COSAG06_NODE_61099_length_268_cov_14.573964_1_plen_75_part_01
MRARRRSTSTSCRKRLHWNCEYKLGAEGLGYYHTELAKSRFKTSLLPGTEPCRPYGHVTPPPGLPGYLSKDMIKR